MQLYDNETSAKSAKLFRIGGWLLIAAGFAIPQAQLYAAGEGAFQAGDEIARTLGSLLLLAVIAWLVTRKKTPKAKAMGTFIVGLLLVITSISVAANKNAAQTEMKAYLQKAVAMQGENKAKLENIIGRIAAINMATVLTMDAVYNKNQRALAQAKLVQFKTLVSERRAQITSGIAQAETLVSSLPEGDMRRGGYAGLENSKKQMAALFGELDVVQLSYAESIESLFSFAGTQDGKMQATSDGRILFSDPAALSQFQALIKKIEEQEILYVAASERAQKKAQEMTANDLKLQKQASEIINK